MATVFTHALTAGALAVAAPPTVSRRKLLLALVVLAVFPDADVVGFWLGIDYGHPLGHRGFTHSFLFALLAGVAVAALAFRELRIGSADWWRTAALLVAATASHGVLDAFTNGGLGVGFFLPFDDGRYFAPFRPLRVSPIGVGAFFEARSLRILASEALWVWVPTIAALAGYRLQRRR